MCGIAGVVSYSRAGGAVDRASLLRIRDRMVARGPDGAGEWYSGDGRVGLAHRRLAIIDLTPGGAQPMLSADGQVAVTFNGEIYNYKALRRELEVEGCQFRSHSDTEVLIHLYLRRGSQGLVKALRGMFAFGLWDEAKKCLLLARDPYGIKPLYYGHDGAQLQFASSVKALLAGGRLSNEPDPAGVVGFYAFGSVPEPFTMYKVIKALPAGHTMLVRDGVVQAPELYASIAQVYCRAETEALALAAPELESRFKAALSDSVRHHLVADVPVGVFLSAGVDSGALVGLMQDAGQKKIQTVTLAFDEYKGTHNDEGTQAANLARAYGTEHRTRWVGAQEFQRDLPHIMYEMDQPSIDGINTWFVAKAARELGLKVALSGVGADELVGGYSIFDRIPARVAWLRSASRLRSLNESFGQVVRAGRALGLSVHPKAAGLLTYGGTFAGAYLLQRGLYLPDEIADLIHDERFVRQGLRRLDPVSYVENSMQPEPRTAFAKIATLESCNYLRNQLLRDTDWAGMAHSLEIRTPYVDYALLQGVAPLFARSSPPSGKTLIARSPNVALPQEIVGRAKTGFGIPLHAWSGHLPPLAHGVNRHRPADGGRLWSRRWARHVIALQGAAQGGVPADFETAREPQTEPDRLGAGASSPPA